MKPLLIGQLARTANVGVETIRFYERNGLLGEPTRRSSGYRVYDQQAVARLNFIRRAKQLGFTLAEIKELLAFHRDPNATRADVKGAAVAKISDIGERIRDLQRMQAALEKLASHCHGDDQSAANCPILEALTDHTREDLSR